MALPNRVSPDGNLNAVSTRGMFTGNRGIIHNPDSRTLSGRRWTTSAWICCSLEWKGKRREVWGRNGQNNSAGWTELFFLDEVTALAAGHRPCHTCRRDDAVRFQDAFCSANGILDAKGKNELLHRQRWLSSKIVPATLSRSQLADLPDGSMVKSGDFFFAIQNQRALPWHTNGYGKGLSLGTFASQPVYSVTPACIIASLREGYEPSWHPSAS